VLCSKPQHFTGLCAKHGQKGVTVGKIEKEGQLMFFTKTEFKIIDGTKFWIWLNRASFAKPIQLCILC